VVTNRVKNRLPTRLPTEAPDLRCGLKPESRGRFTPASAAVLILNSRAPVPAPLLRRMLGYTLEEFNALLGAGLLADAGVEVRLTRLGAVRRPVVPPDPQA
jgi:hypothetical protein